VHRDGDLLRLLTLARLRFWPIKVKVPSIRRRRLSATE
jgi:hypothetical protein